MIPLRNAVALVVVAALLGGCGLGHEQRLADRLMAAADKTQSRAQIGASIRAELRTTSAPNQIAALPGSDVPAPAALEVGVFFREQRAVLRQPGGDLSVFDNDRIYVRRPEATPDDARPWLELHLEDLRSGATPFDPADYKSGATYAALSVLDPRLILDLAASPLSGSLKDLGNDAIDGQPVKHYAANFDFDKALDDRRRKSYDDDRRERVRRILHLLSISRTVNPGEVWLDGSGLRRVRIELQVRPSHYDVSQLIITIELGGDADKVAVPDRRQTVVVDALAALQRSTAQLGAPSRG